MTDITSLNQFLSGAFMMAALAVALFFREYWRRTHERLFAIFALAFATLALEHVVLAFVPRALEGRHWIFLARLSVFALIIAGIVDKNRTEARSTAPSEGATYDRDARHDRRGAAPS